MIITKDMLVGMDGAAVSGIILCKDYSVQFTKGGKEYISGNLQAEAMVSFKAWGDSEAFHVLRDSDFQGKVVEISGSFNEYNGVMSIILGTVREVSLEEQIRGGYAADKFLPCRYNIDAYYDALVCLTKKLVSERGYNLADTILFSNSDLVSAFKYGFAAMSNHDNCKGGLLAHTYKVCLLVSSVISSHRKEFGSERWADLLVLGGLLHDVGKVKEMRLGIYEPYSYVTHRYFGVELLVSYKDMIISAYDEKFYYDLISIIMQHHGEYGERCKTVASQVIHLVDNFESDLTFLAQSVGGVGSDCGKIKYEGNWLEL